MCHEDMPHDSASATVLVQGSVLLGLSAIGAPVEWHHDD